MTNKEVIERANEILLEKLDPYVMFPKWAELVRYLDFEFDELKGIRHDYHDKWKEKENDE